MISVIQHEQYAMQSFLAIQVFKKHAIHCCTASGGLAVSYLAGPQQLISTHHGRDSR